MGSLDSKGIVCWNENLRNETKFVLYLIFQITYNREIATVKPQEQWEH